MNARGCGGTTLSSPQAFCAAYTEDVRQVVRNIAARYPHAPLYAVGYSLGSNILVKYLGEEGDETPIRGAVSVANPFNLIESNRYLHKSYLGRELYSRYVGGMHCMCFAAGLGIVCILLQVPCFYGDFFL